VLLSFANLAGVQSKVAQFMRDVVGDDGPIGAGAADPLLGGPMPAQAYVTLKAGSHVE
jgi:hypothetical protein